MLLLQIEINDWSLSVHCSDDWL